VSKERRNKRKKPKKTNRATKEIKAEDVLASERSIHSVTGKGVNLRKKRMRKKKVEHDAKETNQAKRKKKHPREETHHALKLNIILAI